MDSKYDRKVKDDTQVWGLMSGRFQLRQSGWGTEERISELIAESRMLGGRSLLLLLLAAAAAAAAAAAKSLQTLCDPIDGSPPSFPVSGILQARTLEWVGEA